MELMIVFFFIYNATCGVDYILVFYSAIIELFEFLRKENLKNIIAQIVENHRQTLSSLSYVPVFEQILVK
jgi:hypothetical protein